MKVMKTLRVFTDILNISNIVSASREFKATPLHQQHHANAKVLRRVGMEGEKKYSPPLGTTHSVGSESVAFWFLGFTPDMERGPIPLGPLLFWPTMGSIPGMTGFSIGNPVSFAQPAITKSEQLRIYMRTSSDTHFAG